MLHILHAGPDSSNLSISHIVYSSPLPPPPPLPQHLQTELAQDRMPRSLHPQTLINKDSFLSSCSCISSVDWCHAPIHALSTRGSKPWMSPDISVARESFSSLCHPLWMQAGLTLKPTGPIAPNWAPRPILQTLVQVDWEPETTEIVLNWVPHLLRPALDAGTVRIKSMISAVHVVLGSTTSRLP